MDAGSPDYESACSIQFLIFSVQRVTSINRSQLFRNAGPPFPSAVKLFDGPVAVPEPMREKEESLVVVGIDVGGLRKGFHAVAFKGGTYYAKCSTTSIPKLVTWCCSTVQAQVVGIDAPCRWSNDGRARPAERQLMGSGIWCFSTPTYQMALDHSTDHFGWMLNGAELFQALELTHPLPAGFPFESGKKCCFETFPHAIASALLPPPVLAANKRKDRKKVLKQFGVDTSELINIDLIDAALCALTAHFAASGQECKAYGERATGLMILPIPPQLLE